MPSIRSDWASLQTDEVTLPGVGGTETLEAERKSLEIPMAEPPVAPWAVQKKKPVWRPLAGA
jgi:hypothetical protein